MLLAKAYAKINWTLDILGTLPNGYHEMDMLMTSVSVFDTLTLQESDTLSLALGDAKRLPADERNLVLKAAKALRAVTGCARGAAMRLEKRIPVGAGMGGGSADAAAALVALTQLWRLDLSLPELCEIGLRIGADIPFLLTGGTARVGGVGQRITPLCCPKPFWLIAFQPCRGLSTPEVFSAFDSLPKNLIRRPRTDDAQAALLAGDEIALAGTLANALEAVSVQKRPEISQATAALQEAGALQALMTGSGSAVFGLFASQEAAQSALPSLWRRWPRATVLSTREGGVEVTEIPPDKAL